MDFSETIVVCDEYMRLYEYQMSRSFIDIGQIKSDSIFLNFFSSIINHWF